MTRSHKFTFIKKSPLLSVPLAGSIIYRLQFGLYKRDLINTIYLSLKDNILKDDLLDIVTNTSEYIVSQSYHFVRNVQGKKSKVIADFMPPEKLIHQTKNVLEDVAWALIWSEYITERSKKSFGNFIPQNFPVFFSEFPKQTSIFNIFLTTFIKQSEIEILVWDFDGTLFFSPETAKQIEGVFASILSKYNKVSLKQARSVLNGQRNTTWSSAISRLTGLKEKKVLLLLEKKVNRTKYAKKDKRLIETFGKLKIYRHIILTNSTSRNTTDTLRALGFVRRKNNEIFPFEKIFSLDNLKNPKPDESAFKSVLEYTKLPPQKHLMIGDFESVDILPAKALKFMTFKVGHKSSNSDFNSASIYEIPDILKDNK